MAYHGIEQHTIAYASRVTAAATAAPATAAAQHQHLHQQHQQSLGAYGLWQAMRVRVRMRRAHLRPGKALAWGSTRTVGIGIGRLRHACVTPESLHRIASHRMGLARQAAAPKLRIAPIWSAVTCVDVCGRCAPRCAQVLAIDEVDECFAQAPDAMRELLSRACAPADPSQLHVMPDPDGVNKPVLGKPQVVFVGATQRPRLLDDALDAGWLKDPVQLVVGPQERVPAAIKHRWGQTLGQRANCHAAAPRCHHAAALTCVQTCAPFPSQEVGCGYVPWPGDM